MEYESNHQVQLNTEGSIDHSSAITSAVSQENNHEVQLDHTTTTDACCSPFESCRESEDVAPHVSPAAVINNVVSESLRPHPVLTSSLDFPETN